jgi:hypothetical protein
VIAEDRRAARLDGRALELIDQARPVEDVVAEDERRRRVADELPADDERLREPVRHRLLRVRERDTPPGAVAEQVAESR